jgi:hypothetical protein
VSAAAYRRVGFGLALALGLGTAWGAWRSFARPSPVFGSEREREARALMGRLAAGLAALQEPDGGFALWTDRPKTPDPEVVRTASSALAAWALVLAARLEVGPDEGGEAARARDRALGYLLERQAKDGTGGFGRMPVNPLGALDRGPQVTAVAAGLLALVADDPKKHALAIARAARALGVDASLGLRKGWMRAAPAMAIDALLAAGRTGDFGPHPRLLLPLGEERDAPDCGDYRVAESIVRVLRGEATRGDTFPARVLEACVAGEPLAWNGEASDLVGWLMQGWLALRAPGAPGWYARVLGPLEDARGPGDVVPTGLYSDRVAQTASAILILAWGLQPQPVVP